MTSPAHILVTGSTRGIGAAVTAVLGARSVRMVGHGTHTWAVFWKNDLADLLQRSGG